MRSERRLTPANVEFEPGSDGDFMSGIIESLQHRQRKEEERLKESNTENPAENNINSSNIQELTPTDNS